MTEVIYIHHDGFVVRLPDATLVFDYWRGDRGDAATGRALSDISTGVPLPPGVTISSPLYVFISHFHKDHYDPCVFEWAERLDEVYYIVSKDVMQRMRHILSASSIYNGPRPKPSRIICLRPGDVFNDGRVTVRAFPSTDLGNSYAVRLGDTAIFHAGDLNAWIWKDESTEQEVAKSLGDFRACLRDIENAGFTKFDMAFFPVDSRIGTDYFTGAKEFVHTFDVRRFFPMHFGLGDSNERAMRRADALRFDLYMNRSRGEYIGLTAPGDRYAVANPLEKK